MSDPVTTPPPTGQGLGERLAAVVGQHRTEATVMGGWHAKFGPDADTKYGWDCSCGEHSPDPFVVYLTAEQADAGRDAHVAAALVPLVEAEVAAAKADALREAADDWHDIEAAIESTESVILDAEDRPFVFTPAERYRIAVCNALTERADRIAEGVQSDG